MVGGGYKGDHAEDNEYDDDDDDDDFYVCRSSSLTSLCKIVFKFAHIRRKLG